MFPDWGLRVKNSAIHIGPPQILHTFMYSVHRELEPGDRGSRFPLLLDDLYISGKINGEDGKEFQDELNTIRSAFVSFAPDNVIWIFNKKKVCLLYTSPSPRDRG